MYQVDPNDRILMPKFQKELYRRIGNTIIKKVIDVRDKAYENLQNIKNVNFRRKQELNQTLSLKSKNSLKIKSSNKKIILYFNK